MELNDLKKWRQKFANVSVYFNCPLIDCRRLCVKLFLLVGFLMQRLGYDNLSFLIAFPTAFFMKITRSSHDCSNFTEVCTT